MDQWKKIPTDEIINKTVEALTANGIKAEVAQSGEEAKEKALSLIPEKSEVMTMTSITLDTIGLSKEINESGKYDAIRPKLMKMDRKTQSLEMQKLGAAPEYTVGSIHAVTEDGHVLIASNTGSQLSAYVYGSAHVIWVVGAQKIVSNFDQGLKRIYDYVLPLESERANKAYNMAFGSFVSKLLVINKEVNPTRLNLIIVKEELGF